MTRTMDMSLIQRMGFQDPDKKDSKHDLVCQYLADYDTHTYLMKSLKPNLGEFSSVKAVFPAKREVVISKGEGQYKTHVGFLDLMYTLIVKYPTDGALEVEQTVAVIAEVKTHKQPVGDFIRQLNLYREHEQLIKLNHRQIQTKYMKYMYVLVTTFPLNAMELKDLENAGIHHRKLSEESFSAWMEHNNQESIPDQTEI